jgi:predicted AlkP superfamily pyrophosphatase or phosphodiesterase
MSPPARRATTLAAAICLAAAPPALAQRTTPPRSATTAAPPRPVPTLVVFFTVDQMRPDYLSRFEPQLVGGLERLYHHGAVFTEAYQDHAVTETAPGHASTLSGRFPRSTGIVTNSTGVGDPQAPLVGSTGPGASPFRFRGSTLTDWLRSRDARTRALSVSRKDRGAILPLGRAKQSVFWYDPDYAAPGGGVGGFTTSRYYADTLPGWVTRFNARNPIARYAGTTWRPLLPDSAYREPDSVRAENGGKDYVFPHVLPTDPRRLADEIRSVPTMDSLILAAALDGLRTLDLGRGPQTDVLAISLSTTDAVGHRYGPDSKEQHDQILRLDRFLGAFFDSLYAVRDSARIVVALTADHGVSPSPNVRSADANRPTGTQFIDSRRVLAPVRAGLAARGADTTAVTLSDGVVQLDRAALARAGVNADSLVRSLAATLRATPGIMRAETMREVAARDTTKDDVARRWMHMIPPDLDVALVVTPRPYWEWGWGEWPMATHGIPQSHDAHVPLIFYGPAFTPGRYTRVSRVVDIAPTLAAVLGVPPTEKLDGRVLTEALKK